MGKVIAVVGFLALALSPSFVDFQQSPEFRPAMLMYYTVTISLIIFGLDNWLKD